MGFIFHLDLFIPTEAFTFAQTTTQHNEYNYDDPIQFHWSKIRL